MYDQYPLSVVNLIDLTNEDDDDEQRSCKSVARSGASFISKVTFIRAVGLSCVILCDQSKFTLWVVSTTPLPPPYIRAFVFSGYDGHSYLDSTALPAGK